MADKKLKITLVKSTIGAVPKNKAIVESMGLRKIGKSVVLPADPDSRTGQPVSYASQNSRRPCKPVAVFCRDQKYPSGVR